MYQSFAFLVLSFVCFVLACVSTTSVLLLRVSRAVMSITTNVPETIQLNVGGESFTVLLSTIATGDYFKNILSIHDGVNPVFVNRSPVLFRAVLHFIVYRAFRVPVPFSPTDVADELRFFGFSVPVCSATVEWHRLNSVEPLTAAQEALVSELCSRVLRPLSEVPQAVIVVPSLDSLVERAKGLFPNVKFALAICCRSFVLSDELHALLSAWPSCESRMASRIASVLKREHCESSLVVTKGSLVAVDCSSIVLRLEEDCDSFRRSLLDEVVVFGNVVICTF